MKDLHFTWDPKKATANLRKHGVSFEEASTAFRNPLATVLPDPTHSGQEERFLIIGHSATGRLVLVRIISARETSARERREYEEHS